MVNLNNIGKKFNNPIGVIGAFLVLTEAIASTVIVNSKLNDIQNTILVIFIVLFPCLVLGIFYLLVTKHHEKLYSPSDYKDERNFVNTYNSNTQKEDITMFTDIETNICNDLDENIIKIKEALSDVIELQKKIIPTVQNSVISETDKEDYLLNMDEFLTEMSEGDSKVLKVNISPMYKCNKFVEDLVKQGYIASIYRLGMNKKMVNNIDHQAIWLGTEVPLQMSVNVIKKAKSYYPHLRYIQLSDAKDGAPDYVKYNIYIGGATTTAQEQSLRALDIHDFEKLYSSNTLKELHDFIKRFDPKYDYIIK